jgi:HEAT repeat protein
LGFYDLPEKERKEIFSKMENEISKGFSKGETTKILEYAGNDDTYIRKNAYIIIGKLYQQNEKLRNTILQILKELYVYADEKVRQTTVYAYGEIGKIDPSEIMIYLELALSDAHHSVRNAVISSIKQMVQNQPKTIMKLVKKYLIHPNPKVRKDIIQGIEIRGRTNPEDVLPVLKEAQYDTDEQVRKTLIHVLGQISYKNGCLEKVITELKKWENKNLVKQAIVEILEAHKRYADFAAKTYQEAKKYIEINFK